MSEILEAGEVTLGELAVTALREHDLALSAGVSMVDHAISAGEALLAAKARCAPGQWLAWLAANFSVGEGTAQTYMRIARHKDRVRAAMTLTEAREYLTGIDGAARGPARRYPDWMREAAADMVEQGRSRTEIASELGVSTTSIRWWTDAGAVERNRSLRVARDRAQAAERDRRARASLERAARAAGTAMSQLYADAERMQDVIGRAHSETSDSAVRAALARAGEHYRRMRDEIVKALGAS